MKLLIFILAWAALLAGAIAAPAADLERDVSVFNSMSHHPAIRLGDYKESLQLGIMESWEGVGSKKFHCVYHCSQGHAVQPCLHDKKCPYVWCQEYFQGVDWNNPPFPKVVAKAKAPFLDAKDCFYQNDGQNNAGMLTCGEPNWWFRDDLKPDPGAHDPVIHCARNQQWKNFARMSYVEY